MKRILEIQEKLKCAKNQFNKFGGYNYRSCEDILEAVKPLLKEQKLFLTLTDSLELIGERYYIKASATIYDTENGNAIMETHAYAREEETKKGMDGSQITGASSSYARKYALNGLFLIDDVKDSDTTNIGEEKNEIKTKEQAENYTVNFGSHSGETLADIIATDPQYANWLYKNGDDTIKSALKLLKTKE